MSISRKLKVYGWRGWRHECPAAPNGGRQTREIVAAASLAAARMLVTDSWHRPSRAELCETGNAAEIQQAMKEPGTVFWRPLDSRDNNWQSILVGGPGESQPKMGVQMKENGT